jgi:hypothetical protein
MRNLFSPAAAAAMVLTGLVTPAGTALAVTPTCDRACLEGLMGKYFDAALAHDPHRLPLTKNVKFTENGQTLELGDGLWRTLTAKGMHQMIVADADAGSVAFLGSIREADIPAMLAVRLRVRRGQISEIETLVQRSDKSAEGFDKIGYTWTDAVPAAERMSRADLVRVANMYFAGLERNDGKGDYPFADDCNRIENGTNTTNMPTPAGQTRPDPKTASNYSGQWSCMEQFKSGLLHFVSRIRDRRYVAVDPERGLVFSFIFFDHSAGDTRTFLTPDGRTVTAGPKQPWTWELAETFKLEKGRIHQIMAIMEHVPYGMQSGWSTRSEAMSSKARDVTK